MSLENVLSMVDAPKAQPETFLSPQARTEGERAAKARFFAVLAEDPQAVARARSEASEAFKNAASAIMLADTQPAPVVLTATERRSNDVALLTAQGFAMRETTHAAGIGVSAYDDANTRKIKLAREQFDRMPGTVEACAAIVAAVEAEARGDRETTLGAIEWQADGLAKIDGDTVALTERALSGVVTRIGCGGHAYLASACSPALRSANLAAQIGQRNVHDAPIVLRERTGKSGRIAYASVSKGYAAYDADKIAQAVAMALPDTRASIVYDGERVKIEALSHTTVSPDQMISGETFRVGVRVSSDDTGGGSIKIDGIAFQAVCRNMSIINVAAVPFARVRHVGSVAQLAEQVRNGLADARHAIAPFLARWNAACSEELRERAQSVATKTLPRSDADFIRGVFANLIDTKQVTLPGYRGEAALSKLADAWTADVSSATSQTRTSRAAIVNAITRAAHEIELSDAFDSDEIERSACSLLWLAKGRNQAPALDYLDPELMGKRGDASA